MIKIDDRKIKAFSTIKRKHEEWYENNIYSNLKKSIDDLEKYSHHDKNLEVYVKILKKIEKRSKEYVTDKKFLKIFYHEAFQEWITNSSKKSISKLEKLFQRLNIPEYSKYLPHKIFNYDQFTKGDKNWGRHQLLNMLGIEVCPYCQRNYITNYETNDGLKKTTADLDHFYPKSLFPFLALSLYNFIPSCQVCNSRFKLDKKVYKKKLLVIYPYSESFEEYNVKFQVSSEEIINNLLNESFDFYVRFNIPHILEIKKRDRVLSSINMFGLDLVYKKSHNNYIRNMLKNIEYYPDTHIKDICKVLNGDQKRIYINKVKELALKPYLFKHENNEPLGKLTKDILNQFTIK